MNNFKYRQEISSILISILILIFFLPTVVLANGGPIRPIGSDPQGNGYLIFDPDSGIALEEEWISYFCEKEGTGRAKVNVIYNLKNITQSNLKAQILTPKY